jgi:hypothetical protein
MHEKIALIQVSFDQCFILLSILSRYYQVVLRGDKPVKLFEPEYLSYLISGFIGLLAVLDNLFDSVFLCILNGGIGSRLGLLLLFI